MTNIYNKKVLVDNGTLINNWYEEEALKKITGETRTIPGMHIKKQKIDGELNITQNMTSRDNTKVRILGVDNKAPYSNTNSTYGDFCYVDHHFNKIGIKEKIFKDFFTSYLTNEKNLKVTHDSKIENSRLNDSSYKTSHIKQPIIHKIGSRHMKTQDGIDIDQSELDKLFMAQHEMDKFKTVIPDDKAKAYLKDFVPYYRDKEITFWSMNMDKSNVYKSFSNGENAFARTSGLTQLLPFTRSVSSYYGNTQSSNNSKNIHYYPEEEEFTKKFIEKNQKRVIDLSENIRAKYAQVFRNKGWLAIRKYKQYMFNLLKRRDTRIDKTDFKYFTTNFGVYLSDEEISFIFNIFDLNKCNLICYEQFVNEFLKVRIY